MTSVDIPKQQKAAVKVGSGGDAKAPTKDVDVEMPKANQILVKINWTGLCASDKSLLHDEWAAFGVSMKDETKGIAGHEGAGVVVAVGDNMQSKWKVGDRAGIKWVRHASTLTSRLVARYLLLLSSRLFSTSSELGLDPERYLTDYLTGLVDVR